MNEKSREEKLRLAKMAYKEIMQIIDKWENVPNAEFHCHWDECITVDDELFQRTELSKQ